MAGDLTGLMGGQYSVGASPNGSGFGFRPEINPEMGGSLARQIQQGVIAGLNPRDLGMMPIWTPSGLIQRGLSALPGVGPAFHQFILQNNPTLLGMSKQLEEAGFFNPVPGVNLNHRNAAQLKAIQKLAQANLKAVKVVRTAAKLTAGQKKALANAAAEEKQLIRGLKAAQKFMTIPGLKGGNLGAKVQSAKAIIRQQQVCVQSSGVRVRLHELGMRTGTRIQFCVLLR